MTKTGPPRPCSRGAAWAGAASVNHAKPTTTNQGTAIAMGERIRHLRGNSGSPQRGTADKAQGPPSRSARSGQPVWIQSARVLWTNVRVNPCARNPSAARADPPSSGAPVGASALVAVLVEVHGHGEPRVVVEPHLMAGEEVAVDVQRAIDVVVRPDVVEHPDRVWSDEV